MRTPAVASKTTFSPPPLDGSLTLPEIYDFHYYNSPSHPLFTFSETDGSVTNLSWSQVVLAVHHGQQMVESATPPVKTGDVVAILASTDAPTYWTLIMSIMRAGLVPFPVSTRNSDVGVAHLLLKTEAAYVFVSEDAAMQSTFASACELLAQGGQPVPSKLSLPTFDELYQPGTTLLPPLSKPDLNSVALILHSSGSTSFPKPIRVTHRQLFGWTQAPMYGGIDLCGHALSIHTLPMFHSMGSLQICWTAVTGMISSVFSPYSQPVSPTPDLVLDAAIATKSSLIFCIPSAIEHWARDPSRLPALQGFQALVFAGAPLDQDVGDRLIEQGVSLVPAYGLTETGPLTVIFPNAPAKEGWAYFQIAPNCNPVFLPYADTPNVFQLVLVECPTHAICLVNTEVDGKRAYDTNDLLVRHPTRMDLWRVHGRADDQLMHSSGEKTNPGPIEGIVNKHPMISRSLVFGRSKFHAGILIEPAPGYEFDVGDLAKLAEFRNDVWSSVEEANHVSPSHSRIFKEMIIFTSPAKPFMYTPKGTPRRQVCLDAYEGEIEAVYQEVENSVHADVIIPTTWNYEESLAFARSAVGSTMAPVTVGDTDDLFSLGCDSLQATWIRNTLLHGLRSGTKLDVRRLPQGFVYDHPTISGLASFLASAVAGESTFDIAGTKVAEMESLLDLYTQDLPIRPSAEGLIPSATDGDVVLLTGSTGGLGSYILEGLLQDPTVLRVYALNRKASQSLIERQAASFKERGVDAGLLDSPKLVLLEGDASKELLGLPQPFYDLLQQEVTNIIHNAWRVDFNIALSSMAPLVAGTRRLVDLALSSPRRLASTFTFTSSIGVLRNWAESTPAPEMPVPASMAISNGYGESKWVAEALLIRAAELNPSFHPTVVRVGQLSGGSNGSWNTSEWLPSVIKSGQAVGCLPSTEGILSWLPCNVAGAALVESRNSRKPFMNLCHPNPVPWTDMFEHFAMGLDVPLVPYSAWLAALDEANEDPNAAVENPALMLLEFFRASDIVLPHEQCEALGFPRLEVQAALDQSVSMSRLKTLGQQDVEQWLHFWRRTGFLV